MAEKMKAEQPMRTDFADVVNDISNELVARMTMDDDGSIIDMFQTGSYDPWQMMVFFGAMEDALTKHRTDKRCKTVFIHAQPEELVGIGRVVTPMTTLLEHVLMNRIEDMNADRVQLGAINFNGESIEYTGVNVKGRLVVSVCDLVQHDSRYLRECISMIQEMKAAHVVALPMMVWNPEFVDHIDEEEIKKAWSQEKKTLS